MILRRLLLGALFVVSTQQAWGAQAAHVAMVTKNFFDKVTKNNTLPRSHLLAQYLHMRLARSKGTGKQLVREMAVLDSEYAYQCFAPDFDKALVARVPYFFADQVEQNLTLRVVSELGCYVIGEVDDKIDALKAMGVAATALRAVTVDEFCRRLCKKYDTESLQLITLEESGKFAKVLLQELKKAAAEY